jgi:iturin family lipopeptide synthetase A
MILKKNHFIYMKINWQDKSQNITELANELNLSRDSFIFVDDSNMECTSVMTNCPEVLTLQLPKVQDSIPIFLEHVWAFDKLVVTDADLERTKMYKSEQNEKAYK